jgi:hypothetical protein
MCLQRLKDKQIKKDLAANDKEIDAALEEKK